MTEEEIQKYVKKYPFLQVRTLDDTPIPGSCYLTGMPKGWIKAFADPMLEDFANAMAEDGLDMNEVRIIDVKEKFGSLRWYWGFTKNSKKLADITHLYENVSSAFCAKCGAHPVMMTSGYILPLCERCMKEWKATSDFDEDRPFKPCFPQVTISRRENGIVIEEEMPLKQLFDKILNYAK